MASSNSAISNLPEGYTMEQSSAPQPQQGEVSGLPAGYKLESNSSTPSSAAAPAQPLLKQIEGQPFIDEVRSSFSPENKIKSLELGAGAAGAAGGVSELYDFALKHLAGNVLPGMETMAAKQTLQHAVPKAIQFAKEMTGGGLTLAGTYELLKHVMGDSKK